MSDILVQNLKFKYAQAKSLAVDDISFEIKEGSHTAIVGLNGSGKSTLARLICGLETPLSGKIEIADNKLLGIVFQSPKNQIVSGVVSRDTAFGPQNLKLPESEIELRTIESLTKVEMLHKAESSTNALSLGQTQKIALSGVIAMDPQILILDEATSMLDPLSKNEIIEFVNYWHSKGNTIIEITHDVDILNNCTNVIAMEHGKVIFNGLAKDYMNSKENLHKLTGEPLPKADKAAFNKKEKIPLFALERVSFQYDDKSNVNNISFNLHKGSLVALTGPSGAGKSTILELCAGLLKPASGGIKGLTPVLAQQNASAALFENFAADDVAFGPKNKGISGKQLKYIVKKSMDDAGLPFEEFGERQTFKLSGGEQRRLSIAGILAMENDVILFDEPTAGLDSVSREKVMNMMRTLADEGKTVLFSTHKMDEADFADREIRIENGEKVKDTYENFLEQFEAQYLLPNPAVEMIKSLRSAEAELSGSRSKKNTPVKHLPAVVRILLFFALFIISLVTKSLPACLVMVVVTTIYANLAGFGPKKLASAFLRIFPFILIFAVLQLVFRPAREGDFLITNWRWFTLTPEKLIYSLNCILRTNSSLACICAFFVSTPEYDLIDGLKILLKPLELIKVPVRYFILVVEIIFRFIPLLVDEACSIIKTQALRGGLKTVNGKIKKICSIVPLIVPIIIQTIKRSENLADAITMRCF